MEIKASSKCPATMLAASRTARVTGRMTPLKISIKTMKGISKVGVPLGTKWDRYLFMSLITLTMFTKTQITKAIPSLNTKCLEAVKV